MNVPAEIVRAVLAHATECAPLECCGLVVRSGTSLRYVPCRNVATDEQDFAIDADDWANAEDSGEVVLVAHSHVFEPARASMADLVGCERSGLPWLIVQAQTGAHVVTEPNGYQAPLEGRKYCFGVFDCQTLCRDWFARVRGIELQVCDVPNGWWTRGEDVMRPHLVSQGFEIVAPADGMPGDVLLMQFAGSSVPQHCAVLLEDGRILHQLINRDSEIERFGTYWRDRTVCAAHYVGTQS